MDPVFQLSGEGLLPEWGSVIAVSQTQGRGQLRRHWVSPPGNLYVSVVLPECRRHDLWGDCMSALQPLLAGYVFAVALEQMGGAVKLKWPNDFLQGERKVGGMLLEERNGMVVLGMGLNLVACPDDSEMRKDCAAKAGILQLPNGPVSPLEVWKRLVNRGKNIYTALIDAFSPSEFISLAAERLAWVGRMVQVHEGGDQVYQARITGLSADGGLVLDRAGKRVTLYSGSILPV
nr:biotin--[acetyl-CoA-carboxylase] ligase [Salidesulfovibrio onnuriiensis]